MRGLWQLLVVLAIAVVVASIGAYYYLFAKKDITAFISDDFNYAVYFKKKTSIFRDLSKYFAEKEISVDFDRMLLLGYEEKEDHAVIFENLIGEFPIENYTVEEIGSYTIYCTSKDICEILKRNYKNPTKSKLRELVESKEGDFIIAYKGYQEEIGNLKLVFAGSMSNERTLNIDGEIRTDNETAAEELEKAINVITGFIYFAGIKGVDLDVDRIDGTVIIKGTIDVKKVRESVKNLNLTQNLTLPTTLP